ncbi:MAG: EAL domain-containing protein [Gammaproteobacteria bacterium]|nr:EAL domain-containing protein [Gammaproteobacteria bacterium]
MTLGLGSLRGRIVILSIVLFFGLLTAAVYLNGLVKSSLARSQQTSEGHAELGQILAELRIALYDAEGSLYQYAVLMDDGQRLTAEAALERARIGAETLHMLAGVRSDAELLGQVQRLRDAIAAIDRDARELLVLLSRVETRYPVSRIISTRLHPNHLRFIGIADALIAELDHAPEAQPEIMRLFQDARYFWLQQIAVVRMYFATRSGVFGQPQDVLRQQLENRDKYMAALDKTLARLTALEAAGKLGLAETDAMEHMRRVRSDFGRDFRDVVALYESNRWRTDVPFLRERLKPHFADVWAHIGAVDARLATLTESAVQESLDVTGVMSGFVWLVTALVAGFILLTNLSYEFLIRRPMGQLTNALRALEQGASYTPLLRTAAHEIDTVLAAFRDMQRQVYARETRLAAILDNVGEGIITVDQQGCIGTFNNAAEQLFQYRAEEVIGRNVSMLMPHPVRAEHDGYIQRYLEAGTGRILGTEVNVTAQRRDGALFPMSIKVTELVLDGRRHFTAIVSDISERKAMLDHLRQLAEHDSLTGLYNRQYFLDELERVVERARRQGGLDCALLYIDLDNFKFVNDTLGHLAGDRLLIEVAGILQKRSRRGDILARLGGDEFAVLLFDVNEDTARGVADSYRQTMADYTFREDGRLIDIGCSIGVAMLVTEIRTKEDLMARADLSCHMAKRAGRNCVHVYRLDDNQSLVDMSADMSWARTIKQSIEANRFDFALQPIVDVQSGRVVSHEVLLRMLDPDGSIIMPSGFIPAAERFGLIVDIDGWVVEHAIALLAKRGGEEHFSLNLSGMTMGDPGFVEHLTAALDRHRVAPERLTFEITETSAIADLAAASVLLERLRALGCRTALDDFGAGYSSFAYLKDLPVDFVKIDGSFVRNIDQDPLHLAMVRSMNEIAHAMGKWTVAEFVGSARALEVIRELSVDFAQGYYTGVPELAGYPAILAGSRCAAARVE